MTMRNYLRRRGEVEKEVGKGIAEADAVVVAAVVSALLECAAEHQLG